jgi:predicted thioesterase
MGHTIAREHGKAAPPGHTVQIGIEKGCIA